MVALAAGALALTLAGSPVTAAPLGTGTKALRLGGGVALIAPFYDAQFAYGLDRRADLSLRYETVVGLLHHPRVGLRWAVADIGRWHLGVRTSFDVSFLGLWSDHLELNSRFFVMPGVVASGPITPKVTMALGLDADVDIVEYGVVDQRRRKVVGPRYAATTPRVAVTTPISDVAEFFVAFRLRIPSDALVVRRRTFLVVPFLEIGATWQWP